MTTYVIRRLLQGVVVLFFSSFLIYSILILSPGGPKDQIRVMEAEGPNGRAFNKGIIDIYTRLYGLDKPYPLDYFLWLFDPSKTSRPSMTPIIRRSKRQSASTCSASSKVMVSSPSTSAPPCKWM